MDKDLCCDCTTTALEQVDAAMNHHRKPCLPYHCHYSGIKDRIQIIFCGSPTDSVAVSLWRCCVHGEVASCLDRALPGSFGSLATGEDAPPDGTLSGASFGASTCATWRCGAARQPGTTATENISNSKVHNHGTNTMRRWWGSNKAMRTVRG